MIVLVQFGINQHEEIFQRLTKLHEPESIILQVLVDVKLLNTCSVAYLSDSSLKYCGVAGQAL